MKLAPIVESLFWEEGFPLLRKIFPRSIGVLPGKEPKLFDVKPGVRVIPLICYEATDSSLTRRFVQRGGNVIVNLVDDTWFLKSLASEKHLSLALFRAVEFRVPVIRVTNSGIGAFIQADGRIVPGSRTALFEKTSGAFPVFIPAQRSFYAKYGNLFLVLLTIALAVALIRDARKFRADCKMKICSREKQKCTATIS
jgi:apolipoprotein N-acyltransferase